MPPFPGAPITTASCKTRSGEREACLLPARALISAAGSAGADVTSVSTSEDGSGAYMETLTSESGLTNTGNVGQDTKASTRYGGVYLRLSVLELAFPLAQISLPLVSPLLQLPGFEGVGL